MAEEEEEEVGLLERHLSAHISVVRSTFSDDKGHGDSVTQPQFQGRATQAATDGPDPGTSVPLQLELAGSDEPGCSGSVRSLCSDSSRHECPICNEPPEEEPGRHGLARLHCDHALCHRCLANILRRARSPGLVRCPFCRQTTPFPQLEIRRLQDESYSLFIQDPEPLPVTTPPLVLEREVEAGCVCPSCLVRGLRLIWQNCLCSSLSVLLLLLLAFFLYIDASLIMLSSFFSD